MRWLRLTRLIILLKRMNVTNRLIVGGSVLALLLTAIGVAFAVRSPLFTVQVVEVEDSAPENAPLDMEAIIKLASVPVGKSSLFGLDLGEIQKRVLANEWVREVQVQKRFPQTLAIRVVYREPKAIIQTDHGQIQYVDSNGHIFGRILLSRREDLPVLSGFQGTARDKIPQALGLIEAWSKSSVQSIAPISTLSFDAERGYRALVTYPLSGSSKARSTVDLGGESGVDLGDLLEPRLARLEQVFTYLVGNRLSARQIWADAGKKIIVKIAHGS